MNKIKNLFTNKNVIKFLLIILGVFFIFLLYEIVYLCVDNTVIFPSLGTIFSTLFSMLGQSYTYEAFGLTLGRTFIALSISFVLGYILGTLGGMFPKFSYFMKPLVALFKIVPVPCFVYLLFIYLHTNKLLAVVVVVFMIIFPIIYEGAKSGIENIDKQLLMSLSLEGRYKPNSIFKVVLPLSFPYVMLALLSAYGLAIKVEITAELLLGSSSISGIGRLVYNARLYVNYAEIYATIIIIVFVFIVFDLLIYLVKKYFLKKN